MKTLWEQALERHQERQDLNRKVNSNFGKYHIGISTDMQGIYIAKEKSEWKPGETTKRDQINAIDIKTAAWIVHSIFSIYGIDEVQEAWDLMRLDVSDRMRAENAK